MYPVNSNFHSLSTQDAPKTRTRIYFIDDTVDCTNDTDVQTNGTLLVWAAGDTDSNGRVGDDGIRWQEYFNRDKNIEIGTAVSSRIEIPLINVDGALNNFSFGRCKVYLDVYDTANSTWRVCPMGVYIIDLPTKRRVKLISASGYDQMQLLDTICDSWWSGLNWSGGITLSALLTSMANQLGVKVSTATASAILNSSVSYTEAPFACVEVTYREVLEYIAEATGTVARFDRNGALDLRWFDQAATVDTETYTDSIVSFVGTSNTSVSSAVVPITPIQNLNGYDHPWPGGGGKNLIPLTLETLKTNNTSGTWNGNVYTSGNSVVTVQTDEGGNVTGISINTNNSALTFVLWLHPMFDGTAIMNGCPSGGGPSTYYLQYSNYVDGAINETGSGTSAFSAYDLESYPNARVLISVKTGTYSNLVFKPMIRPASVSDATFFPYSNVCPITGWTGANVTRCGKNLLDTKNYPPTSASSSGITATQNADGSYNVTGTADGTVNLWLRGSWSGTAPIMKLYAGKKYYIKDVNLFSGTTSLNTTINIGGTGIYTPSKDKIVTGIRATTPNGTQLNTVMYPYIGLEPFGEWTPYTGTTLPISWQTEAGTVYGGTVDVTTGVLTVDRAMVDMGTLTWYKAVNTAGITRFRASIAEPKRVSSGIEKSNILCSNYETKTPNETYIGKTGIALQQNSDQVYIYDQQKEALTATEFKAAMSGVQLCYELATPLTYQLTAQQITALVGQNYMWSSTGGAITVGTDTINPITIDTDTVGNTCLDIDIAEYQAAAIDLLKVKIAEDDIGVTVGSGTNQYTIVNNLFLYGSTATIITNRVTPIYNRLNGLGAYTPIQAKLIYDWSLEAGDVINIVRDSTTYPVLIFQQTLAWRGGYVTADILADGDNVRPVMDYNERASYRMASEMSQKVGDNEIISKINQTAESIQIQASRVDLAGYVTFTNLSTSGQTTVNGGNITTGTIDASTVTVSNINASNISSGTLSAARIGAGSITANKLDSADINASKILTVGSMTDAAAATVLNSNIAIGGRNLCTGTAVSNEFTKSPGGNWFVPYGVWPISTYGGAAFADTANTQWTASFDYSITGVDTAFTLYISPKTAAESGYSGWIAVASIPVGSSSGHAEGTGTITDGERDYAGTSGVLFGMGYTNANAVMTVSNLKVEIGNKATSWTQAPEDVAADIATAQSTAEGANSQEQLIYRSKAVGTTSISGTTTWVTNTTGNQDTWTIKRPQYNTSYPVMFIATQRKTVGGTVTCTTPQIDDTITVIDGGNIITGTVTASQIAGGTIISTNLATALNNTINTAYSNASDALSNAATAQSTAESANSQEQLIYISKVSGTTTQSATTTWVTDTTGNQNTWTIKRPTYNSSYPVLFVATQRKSVGGTVTCTTPQIDNTTTVIDGGHITTGTIDASVVSVTNLNASNISSGTLSADRIAAGSLVIGKLDSATQNTITTAASEASTALTNAATAQSTANGANSQEQLIYRSKVSGTTSLSGTTTWVTDANGSQDTWTIKRPTYNSSYPVLFVATQRKNVAGTVTCTTPQIDNTTTVIDGGHITTGTIDASVVSVTNLNASNITSGTINASVIGVTNLNASNITSGTMSASKISGGTLTLGGSNNTNGTMMVKDANGNTAATVNNNGITINGSTSKTVLDGGLIKIQNASAAAQNVSLEYVPISGTSPAGYIQKMYTPSSGSRTVSEGFWWYIGNKAIAEIYSSGDSVANCDEFVGLGVGWTPISGSAKFVIDKLRSSDIEAKNLSVYGVLDVRNRRTNAVELSSFGWYRAIKVKSNWVASNNFSIDIYIGRKFDYTNNEQHRITLVANYNSFSFVGEMSESNIRIISSIRYTHDSDSGYIDIYYNSIFLNGVCVDFDVHCRPDLIGDFVPQSLYSVGNSPSGETVAATYDFSTLTHGNISSLCSITQTSGGTCTLDSAYRDGKSVYLQISVTPASSTAEGNDLFVGTFSGPLPPASVTGAAYISDQIATVCLRNNGDLFVRASKGTFTTSQTVNISLSYITT